MSDKWFSRFWFPLLIVCAIIQIAAILTTCTYCREAGHSLSCVGSVCRCVDEVK